MPSRRRDVEIGAAPADADHAANRTRAFSARGRTSRRSGRRRRRSSLPIGCAGTRSASQRHAQRREKALVLAGQTHRHAQMLGQSVVRPPAARSHPDAAAIRTPPRSRRRAPAGSWRATEHSARPSASSPAVSCARPARFSRALSDDVLGVGECRDRRRLRHGIHVERLAHAVEQPRDGSVRKRVTDAQAGETISFREGSRDEQVRMRAAATARCRPAAMARGIRCTPRRARRAPRLEPMQ